MVFVGSGDIGGNVMEWVDSRPNKIGFYWCHQNGNTRMVKIWAYKINNPPKNFFTNEDGGAGVSDVMYDGAKWCGPIEPPPNP